MESLVPLDPSLSLGQKTARVVVGLCILATVTALCWTLSFLVAPVAFGFIGYYCLSPLVNQMENRGVPRWAAVLLCFGIGVAALVAAGLIIWPGLESWIQQIPEEGQRSAFDVQLSHRLADWEVAAERMYPRVAWPHHFASIRGFLESQQRGLTETLPALALNALSHAGSFLLAPIISLFLLIDGSAMHRRVISLVPNRYFETTLMLIHRVDRQIAAYLRGAASESLLVTLLLGIALAIAGMPHTLLFACFYGVANIIPVLGPALAAGAGLLYSLMDPAAPSMAILGACYAGTYALDAMLINPLVVGKNLNLHPLTIIVGISVGGGLAGILGMLVSIPLIAVSKSVLWTVGDDLRRRGAL